MRYKWSIEKRSAYTCSIYRERWLCSNETLHHREHYVWLAGVLSNVLPPQLGGLQESAGRFWKFSIKTSEENDYYKIKKWKIQVDKSDRSALNKRKRIKGLNVGHFLKQTWWKNDFYRYNRNLNHCPVRGRQQTKDMLHLGFRRNDGFCFITKFTKKLKLYHKHRISMSSNESPAVLL